MRSLLSTTSLPPRYVPGEFTRLLSFRELRAEGKRWSEIENITMTSKVRIEDE